MQDSLQANTTANVRPHARVAWVPVLRQPLLWVLLVAGLGLIVVAGGLAGRQQLTMGAPSERLYLRDGFDGLEHGPNGTYRWTHATAQVVLPQTGPGAVVVHLTLFDGAHTPRTLALALDGQSIYQGQTRPGGAPWTLDVPATATSANPLLTITTDPWQPPADRRILGVALTALAVDAPDAADRARWAAGMLLAAVLALVLAAGWRLGAMSAAAVAGLGVLGFWGTLLAYGDLWLLNAAPAILVLGLSAAALVAWLPGRRAARWAPLWGALALAALLLLLTLARFNTGDAEGMFQVTAGLVEDGVPWQHSDHTWIKFGLGQPLATVPLYWLGRAWAGAVGADVAQLTRFCVALLNQALIPATALVLFLGARRRYGAGVGLALTGTWLLATPALAYARLAFAEPLSGLLILGAFLLLWVPTGGAQKPSPQGGEGVAPSSLSRQRMGLLPCIGAGLCLGLAVLVKPANAIYIPVPALYLLWLGIRPNPLPPSLSGKGETNTRESNSPPRYGEGPGERSRRAFPPLIAFGLGMLPGLALAAGYNWLRYGNPLAFGYADEGFTTPLGTGLYGLLLSPGKGLIWFAPPVLLAPWALVAMWRSRQPQLRAEVACIGAQAGIVLGFYALWWSWSGNIAWGPRLILPLVPLLLWPLGALAGRRGARVAWWVTGIAGFLVAIPGVLIDQFYYFDINQVYKPGTVAENNMFWTPDWSQIVAHWRFLLGGTREAVLRPSLAQMGLPAGWDTAVPVALVAVALLALVLALTGTRRKREQGPEEAGAWPT